jgi:O-antigen/teichoic acid export membrane protein
MNFKAALMKNGILKNTGYLYISQIAGKILYLILIVFISRYLKVVGLGQYTSSLAIVSIFSILANAGLGNLYIREVAKRREAAIDDLFNLLAIRAILGLLIFSAVLYTTNKITVLQDIKDIIVVFAISALIGSFTQVFFSVLIGYEDMKNVMKAFIINDLVKVAFSIAIILLGGDLFGVAICFLIGTMAAFVYTAHLLYGLGVRPRLTMSVSVMLGYLRKSVPFFAVTLFSCMLFRIDILMLKILQGNHAVGLYRAASSFLVNFRAFPYLFTLTLYPKFSRLFKRDKPLVARLYRKSSLYLLGVNILILSVIFVFGRRLVVLIFGKEFIAAGIILQCAVFAVFFSYQNLINYYLFNAFGKTSLNALIICIAVAINFLLDFLLIPKYSYYGVLVAMAVSYSFMFIVSSLVVSHMLLGMEPKRAACGVCL